MITLSYNAGAGDCWANASGTFNNNGNFMYIGGDGGIDGDPRAWIPFVVNLPKLTIVSAVLRVRSTVTRSEAVNVTIGCEAADNPAAPSSNGDLYGRAMSTAKLNVSLGAYTTGNEYSYNVTSSVQEILNRAGWQAGNTLAILVRDNGTINDNRRQWATVENPTYSEAILDITFNEFIPQAGMI